MTWTRKDFEAVAQTVLDLYPLDPSQDPERGGALARRSTYEQWQRTREALADLCNEQGGLNVNGNRRFDRDRFMARTDAPLRDRIATAGKGR